MNKTEYVQIIEKALSGNVSPQELKDTVSYYRDYIDMEIRKGRSEQEVLEGLGNPRLLVKSIIAAKGQRTESEETERLQEENEQSRGFRIPLFVIIIGVVVLLGLLLHILLPALIPVAIILGLWSFVKKMKK